MKKIDIEKMQYAILNGHVEVDIRKELYRIYHVNGNYELDKMIDCDRGRCLICTPDFEVFKQKFNEMFYGAEHYIETIEKAKNIIRELCRKVAEAESKNPDCPFIASGVGRPYMAKCGNIKECEDCSAKFYEKRYRQLLNQNRIDEEAL
ncbi:MAG: hypothetical protein ACRCRT_06740 [Cetobacterium somerae]